MVKIVWTDRALTDLEDIAEYIEKDSVKYARLTIRKLILKIGLFSIFFQKNKARSILMLRALFNIIFKNYSNMLFTLLKNPSLSDFDGINESAPFNFSTSLRSSFEISFGM